MSVKVSYKKVKNKTEAFKKVRTYITPKLIARFKVNADVSYYPRKYLIEAIGKGFNLSLHFSDKEVVAKLRLSLLFKALKKPVLGSVEKHLKKVI